MAKFLIFANGESKDGVMVQRSLEQGADAHIIAADGGTRVVWEYGLQPHTLIGDMDSMANDELAEVQTTPADILRFPAEKSETDLELAMLHAIEHGATWIRVIGAVGGRFDHMLANVYLLALPELEGVDVAMVFGSQAICLLKPGVHTLHGTQGDTVSLIPLSGDVTGITTQNMKYALNNDTLYFGPSRGISNIMLADEVTVTVGSGLLLCVHTDGVPE